ncbi:TPA: O23 family O-antigen flippase, partial [Escherichia coli]|nr:O23 family O-antigen flippase [Escherichia coli]HAN7782650.1 O23 family O-antigen flippase [Escherichia coli]
GTSTIFFFAIGFFFGINEKSDFILFTITLLSTIGTILQISWYGLLPRLSSSSSLKFLGYIISNGFIYCLIINTLPFVILTLNFTNFFFAGCLYSLFFQLHQYLKNVFVYLGRLKAFYIFDAIGYAICVISITVFQKYLLHSNPQDLFVLLSLCWLLIVIGEVVHLKLYINYDISVKPVYVCIIPTWKTRIANSGFIVKDLLTAYALNILAPVGGLTIYSYASKISTAVFQLFSQYKVNAWVGSIRKKRLSEVEYGDIKKVSLSSSIDFCIFQIVAWLCILPIILYNGTNINIEWYVLSIITGGLLYLIQSMEQPYARFIYMSRHFTDIAIADGINFIIYMVFFSYGLLMLNVYYLFLGIILAQLCSLVTYSLFCKRLFRNDT